MLERIFESGLWSSRFVIVFAVIFSILAAFVLFLIGSADLFHVLCATYDYYIAGVRTEDFHADIVVEIIGAVDLYLIAIVLMIFGFGTYELFISDIDVARGSGGEKVLYVRSLDELKDKIAKVIVMVLVVNFFQRMLHTEYKGALEMLYFALSITALALGLYFLHKDAHNGNGGKH